MVVREVIEIYTRRQIGVAGSTDIPVGCGGVVNLHEVGEPVRVAMVVDRPAVIAGREEVVGSTVDHFQERVIRLGQPVVVKKPWFVDAVAQVVDAPVFAAEKNDHRPRMLPVQPGARSDFGNKGVAEE